MNDVSPKKYEIIKLVSGNEIVGMTIDDTETVKIILPMSFQLIPTDITQTKLGFYPYIPLSSDIAIDVYKSDILHRNTLNPSLIWVYDRAATNWEELVTNNLVPIVGKEYDLPTGELH